MRTHRYIEFCSAALLAAFIATTSPARRWDLNINGKNQRLSEENGSNITSSTSENVTSVSTQRNRSQSSFAFYREGTELSDLVEPKSHRVKVNVSDMIDFAIVGNPKTGTTFMMDWMHRHPEILIPDVEMRAMLFEAKGPGLSVEKLFPLYEQKTFPKKLGFKCPAVVRELPALRNMRDYFPNTKFIVGRYREGRLIILTITGFDVMTKVFCVTTFFFFFSSRNTSPRLVVPGKSSALAVRTYSLIGTSLKKPCRAFTIIEFALDTTYHHHCSLVGPAGKKMRKHAHTMLIFTCFWHKWDDPQFHHTKRKSCCDTMILTHSSLCHLI